MELLSGNVFSNPSWKLMGIPGIPTKDLILTPVLRSESSVNANSHQNHVLPFIIESDCLT